jgi:hypothetical protein
MATANALGLDGVPSARIVAPQLEQKRGWASLCTTPQERHLIAMTLACTGPSLACTKIEVTAHIARAPSLLVANALAGVMADQKVVPEMVVVRQYPTRTASKSTAGKSTAGKSTAGKSTASMEPGT